jgi:hypothetical protein
MERISRMFSERVVRVFSVIGEPSSLVVFGSFSLDRTNPAPGP